MVFIPQNMTDWRKRRSVLFMPSSNERALAKVPDLACDAVIFDLEDAVAPSEQEAARQNLLIMVRGKDFGLQEYGSKEAIIRTSALDDANFAEDLTVSLECRTDAILIPKINTVEDLGRVDEHIKAAGDWHPAVWSMIETPMALMNLREIAASGLTAGFVVGPNDLAKDTGTAMKPGREAMAPWLMMCVAAARAYGLFVLDGVYNNFSDLEGLAAECAQGAEMGFDGKTLIHPKQIDAANAAFSPGEEEMSRARNIVALYQLPENQDKSAVQMASEKGSEMVERLHLGMAEKLLAAYDVS